MKKSKLYELLIFLIVLVNWNKFLFITFLPGIFVKISAYRYIR